MGNRHRQVLLDEPEAWVVGVSHAYEGANAVDALVRAGSEAVVVATPATTHRHLVERCVELGVHVLVEKPLATTAEDVEALQAAAACAARAGTVLAVGHVERFSPVVDGVTITPGAPIRTWRCGPRPDRVRDVGVLVD